MTDQAKLGAACGHQRKLADVRQSVASLSSEKGLSTLALEDW